MTRTLPAAVTALIDRMEARGYVSRKPDPADRRKVMVELAAASLALAREAYLPLQEAGIANLSKYTEAELRLFAKFIADSLAIQDRMTRDFLARHGKS